MIAFHEGDWHVGVEIYRDWASTALRRLENPAWLDCWDGWQMNAALPSDTTGSWTAGLDAVRKAVGNGLYFVQNWNNTSAYHGYEGGIPYPNPQMGRLALLKQTNGRAHQLGVLMTYYIDLPYALDCPDPKTGSLCQYLPECYPDWMMKPDRAWYERNSVFTMGGGRYYTQCLGATEYRAFIKHFAVDVYGRPRRRWHLF